MSGYKTQPLATFAPGYGTLIMEYVDVGQMCRSVLSLYPIVGMTNENFAEIMDTLVKAFGGDTALIKEYFQSLCEMLSNPMVASQWNNGMIFMPLTSDQARLLMPEKTKLLRLSTSYTEGPRLVLCLKDEKGTFTEHKPEQEATEISYYFSVKKHDLRICLRPDSPMKHFSTHLRYTCNL